MRSNLRTTAAALLILMAARGLSAREQKRVWRVGFLSSRARPADPASDYHIGLVRGLNELGYIEGKNLLIEWRYAEGNDELFPKLLAELIRVPVDVIVTDGTPTTLAAQKATSTIPVVFGSAGDPVGNGLVQSLSNPGGNTTGIALLSNDTSVKQMEMLARIVPGLTRLGVLYNPGNPYAASGLKALESAGQTLRIQTIPLRAATDQDLEGVFDAMSRERVGAFIFVPDSWFFLKRKRMADLALKNHLPGMAPGRGFVDAGGLMCYGQNMEANYRRAAVYVDKIFKGTRPADLPVEQPTKLELVINKKTARALGLTIPPELLVQADKVIE